MSVKQILLLLPLLLSGAVALPAPKTDIVARDNDLSLHAGIVARDMTHGVGTSAMPKGVKPNNSTIPAKHRKHKGKGKGKGKKSSTGALKPNPNSQSPKMAELGARDLKDDLNKIPEDLKKVLPDNLKNMSPAEIKKAIEAKIKELEAKLKASSKNGISARSEELEPRGCKGGRGGRSRKGGKNKKNRKNNKGVNGGKGGSSPAPAPAPVVAPVPATPATPATPADAAGNSAATPVTPSGSASNGTIAARGLVDDIKKKAKKVKSLPNKVKNAVKKKLGGNKGGAAPADATTPAAPADGAAAAPAQDAAGAASPVAARGFFSDLKKKIKSIPSKIKNAIKKKLGGGGGGGGAAAPAPAPADGAAAPAGGAAAAPAGGGAAAPVAARSIEPRGIKETIKELKQVLVADLKRMPKDMMAKIADALKKLFGGSSSQPAPGAAEPATPATPAAPSTPVSGGNGTTIAARSPRRLVDNRRSGNRTIGRRPHRKSNGTRSARKNRGPRPVSLPVV